MKTTKVLSMNDKMLKVILLVAIFATQVPLVSVSAQTTDADKPAVEFVYSSGAQMEIGDTVMINKDSLRYLTGERMSTWVYGVPHTIRQLGTKTKPTGVLLRGIYSWIAQGSLIPMNYNKTQEYFDALRAAEEAALAAARAAEEAAKMAVVEEVIEEVVDTVVEVKDTVIPDEPYQIDRFSVGVRGGVAAQTMPAFGFSTLLDLQYAHYWTKSSKSPKLGILTGLSVGYMQFGQNKYNDSYNMITPDGTLDYAVEIDEVNALNRQVQLEIPVMFSAVLPIGLFVNAGPKLILPVYAGYKQTVTGVTLQATDLEMGVAIDENHWLMGAMTPDPNEIKGKNKSAFKPTIGLGAEVGYELPVGTHSLGIGLYATYGINTYKTAADSHVLTITPPDATNVGTVDVTSLVNGDKFSTSYLDAGVKITFHLNWDNKNKEEKTEK